MHTFSMIDFFFSNVYFSVLEKDIWQGIVNDVVIAGFLLGFPKIRLTFNEE